MALVGYGAASSPHQFFERVMEALLNAGPPIVTADERAGRIVVEADWGDRDDRGRYVITLTQNGGIRIEAIGGGHGRRARHGPARTAQFAARLRELLDATDAHVVVVADSPFGDEWEGGTNVPTDRVGPHFARRPRGRLVGGGVALLAAGWIGAVAVGVARVDAGASSCGVEYAMWRAAPVFGPFFGYAATDGCANQSRLEDFFLDLLVTLPQVAGSVMTIVGLTVGERVVLFDGAQQIELSVAPSVGPDHATLSIAGSF